METLVIIALDKQRTWEVGKIYHDSLFLPDDTGEPMTTDITPFYIIKRASYDDYLEYIKTIPHFKHELILSSTDDFYLISVD